MSVTNLTIGGFGEMSSLLSISKVNDILSKEAGSTRFQNLQERFGKILRIAPLVRREHHTTLYC